MAHTVRDVNTDDVHRVDDEPVSEVADYRMSVGARLVSFIGGLIIALLGLRFILMLFGANETSSFVNFIYTLSLPFAAPFFGIFNYQQQLGSARFEFETLIAILVYALVTWGLVRLITLGKRSERA